MEQYRDRRCLGVFGVLRVYGEADGQGLNRQFQSFGADGGSAFRPVQIDVVDGLGDFDHEVVGFMGLNVGCFGDDVRLKQLPAFDGSYPAAPQGFVDGR